MTKIMLVEDDKSLREIYSIRLVAEGYDIVSAGDGEEALAMAVREKPDLIISDVMMPKISGFDMLDILRSTEETKNIKIIMMTALSSEDQRRRGETLGADLYLVKSQVGIEDVINAVHMIIGDKPVTNAGANLNTVAAITPKETPAQAPTVAAEATAPAQAAPAQTETTQTQATPVSAVPAQAPMATSPQVQAPDQNVPAEAPVQTQAPVAPADPTAQATLVQAAPAVQTIPVTAPAQSIPVAAPPAQSIPVAAPPVAQADAAAQAATTPTENQAAPVNVPPASTAMPVVEGARTRERVIQPLENPAAITGAPSMEQRIAKELGENNAPAAQ